MKLSQITVHMSSEVNSRYGLLAGVTPFRIRNCAERIEIRFLRDRRIVHVDTPFRAASFDPGHVPRLSRSGNRSVREQAVANRTLFTDRDDYLVAFGFDLCDPDYEHASRRKICRDVGVRRQGAKGDRVGVSRSGDKVSCLGPEHSDVLRLSGHVPIRSHSGVHVFADDVPPVLGGPERHLLEVVQVPPEDVAGYREVKSALSIPIAGGECEFTRLGFRDVLVSRAMDIIQPDTCAAGGLSECKKIADMAEAFGVRYNPHVWGTGIAIAASLQLLAVLPSHTPPSLAPLEPMLEFDRTEHPIRQAILTQPIEHIRGVVAVPDGAGLGIEIDRHALARFAAR